jgi:hypothetical protein
LELFDGHGMSCTFFFDSRAEASELRYRNLAHLEPEVSAAGQSERSESQPDKQQMTCGAI